MRCRLQLAGLLRGALMDLEAPFREGLVTRLSPNVLGTCSML